MRNLVKNISYLSFLRIINLVRLRISYFFSKNREIGLKNILPSFISVEPANFCQLRCPECSIGQATNEKKSESRFFKKTMFRKLIDELKPTLTHVIFYFQGEPLLNGNLSGMIRYAHDAGIYTSTSTNAQMLHGGMAKALVKSGLDKLIVSIDGINQETYEKYRRGGSLEKAIEGVKNIVAMKKKLKSTTPFLEIQFLVLKTNENQLAEMKKLAKTLGADKLTFKTAQLHNFENGHELLTSIKKYARYEKRADGKYHIKSKLSNRCWRLWSGAVVNTNGNVLPCCFDKNSDFPFGNVQEKSFAECWHSEKAVAFRKKILQNRKQFDICRNCTN